MEYNLNNEIREVLKSNAELVEIEGNSFEKVKRRIEGKKVRRFKGSQLAASFMLIITAVILSMPSLRVMATEAIQRLIYVPVKSEIGEGYVVTKIFPDDEGVTTTMTMTKPTDLSDEELSKQFGINVSFPKSLGEDIILINESISTLEEEETKSISAEYKKLADTDTALPEFLVSIDTSDSDLESYGDNIKEVSIKGIKAYYKELPIATNPEHYLDPSINPEGYRASKEICWELNGVNYKILALNESISLETLIEKAEIVMESN